MLESVILQTPLALLLYGIALGLCLFDRQHNATNGVFTLASTALAVGATVYAIIMGASLAECAVVLMVFLLLNMGVRE